MRNIKRQEQIVYVCKITGKTELKDSDGNYTGEYASTYSNPIKYRMCLNPTIGDSNFSPYGATQDVRREMTTHDMSLTITYGDLCYIDVVPELNTDGSLKIDTNSTEPTVMYDYTITSVMKSKKGDIARYGITKRSN